MTHVTYRLTAKNRYQLRNPTLGDRVSASFTFTSVATVSSACPFVFALVGNESVPIQLAQCWFLQG